MSEAAFMDANGRVQGQIEFVGKGNPDPAKFMIIPKDVDKQEGMEYFIQKELLANLGLKEPKVLLSVTGGAQDFKMLSSKLEQVFNRGIVRAAESTTAWIVTGGLDTGVMEFVGDAIKNQDSHDVPCIGIATLAKVSHSEILKPGGKVYYSQQKANDKFSAALNPNHTHFLLVDGEDWGAEIPVRTALEDYISVSFKVPVVLIVVNGGPGTITTVAEGAARKFPIIIVDGSGRAADAIADLIRKSKKNVVGKTTQWDELTKTMSPNAVAKWKSVILESVENITIFNPNKEATSDMDLVILQSILNGSRQTDSFISKLFLGVEWNRADVIQELLETDDESESSDIKREALNKALQMSLELDRPQIVSLLVDKGADKSKVDLKRLYRLESVRYLVDRLLPYSGAVNSDLVLPELNNVSGFASAAAAYHGAMYDDVQGGEAVSSKQMESAKKVLKRIHPMYYKLLVDGKTTFTDMVLWSIMVNRHDLAQEIWKHAVLPVHLALVASHLYKTLADWFQGDEDYPKNAEFFEEQAIKVLDKMEYEVAKKCLQWEWLELEKKNAMQIAEVAQCKSFLSHQYVQRYLDEVLYSDEHGELMVGSSSLTVLRLIMFPFKGPYLRKPDSGASFYHVYNLPIVKFWSTTIAYLIFLGLLGTVLIFHSKDIQVIEYALWGWVAANLIEEVSQFFEDRESHFDRISNRMDALMLFMLVIYIILRVLGYFLENESIYYASTDVLIIATIFCFIRLLNVFAFSKHLGPLFFVLIRLLRDVSKWTFIYIVFMISFQLGIMSLTAQQEQLSGSGSGSESESEQTMWTPYPDGTFGVAITTIIGDYSYAMPLLQQTKIGVVLLAVYAYIAQIMLVNLLIAMMGDTYSEVKENSDKEWKFYRYSLVCDYCVNSPFPPPFNLIMKPAVFLYRNTRNRSIGYRKVVVTHEPYRMIATEGTPLNVHASDDLTIKKMKIAKERTLEDQEEEASNSMQSVSDSIREHLRLMTNQRDSDRLFLQQSLENMQTTLLQMQARINELSNRPLSSSGSESSSNLISLTQSFS